MKRTDDEEYRGEKRMKSGYEEPQTLKEKGERREKGGEKLQEAKCGGKHTKWRAKNGEVKLAMKRTQSNNKRRAREV